MEDLKEKIKRAYERGEGSFQQLSEKYNVKLGTIKSWAKRDKDEGNQWFKIATKTKNQNKKVAKGKKAVAEEKKEIDLENKVIQDSVEKVLENEDLNDKQKLFCIYYIKCFNATKAYQKAYGCSYATAMVEGSKALRNPKIGKEIERLKADKLKGAYLSPKDILQRYIDIALSDINDYTEYGYKEVPAIDKKGQVIKDKDGNPITYKMNYVLFKDSKEVDGTLISEISQGKDGAKLKLESKKGALDFLAKYSGLLDIETQQKLDIERRKMELAEKNADTLDDDIEYMVEDESYND